MLLEVHFLHLLVFVEFELPAFVEFEVPHMCRMSVQAYRCSKRRAMPVRSPSAASLPPAAWSALPLCLMTQQLLTVQLVVLIQQMLPEPVTRTDTGSHVMHGG